MIKIKIILKCKPRNSGQVILLSNEKKNLSTNFQSLHAIQRLMIVNIPHYSLLNY